MIDIKVMKNKEWQELKGDLEIRLNKAGWKFERIVRASETLVAIEGGSIPIAYDIKQNRSYVWNKCSRLSGGVVSIEYLVEIKKVLEDWGATICKN